MGDQRTETVTVLFCDVVDSTARAVAHGDAQADSLRHDLFAALKTEVELRRGCVVKNLGDGLMVTFMSIADAIHAACGMQKGVARLSRSRHPGLSIRVGVSTGEASREVDDWFGTPVVQAARLCDAAEAGEVLVSDVVRLLLGSRSDVKMRPVDALDLKGIPDPVDAWSLEWEPVVSGEVLLPVPRTLDLTSAFPLVGREAAHDFLVEAWDEAESGSRRTVFVEGEAGIGKTRLAAALSERVAGDGGFVLYGRCEEGMGMNYQPFVEALSHVVKHTPPDMHAEVLGPNVVELSRLDPDLNLETEGRPTTSDPATEQYLLFEAVARWLETQSAVAPVLLVLDDLHWAPRATLQMLHHLLVADHEPRLLVLAMFRDTQIDRSPALDSFLADLRRVSDIDHLPLQRLDVDAVASLVKYADVVPPGTDPTGLAQKLRHQTGGNPFFATEMLISLGDDQWQPPTRGARSPRRGAGDGLTVPDSVRDVVRHRLSSLPDDCRAVVRAGAIVGDPFEVDLVAAVVDRPEVELIDALEAATRSALVVERGTFPLAYGFTHAIVRTVVVDDLSTARRRQLHLEAAKALERLRPIDDDRYIGRRARHRVESAMEPEAALEAVVAAAQSALDLFAEADALEWLTQAESLFAAAEAPDSTRIDVMTMKGIALRRVGRVEHRDVLLEAGRLAEAQDDGQRMARAALANGRGWQSDIAGIDEARVLELERALDRLGAANPDLQARLQVRLAAETMLEADPARRLQLVEQALATARAGENQTTLAEVLNSRQIVLLGHDTIAQRRADSAELIPLADELGDPVLRYYSRAFSHFWRMQACEVPAARAAVCEAADIATTLGQPVLIWIVRCFEAALARWAGDLDASCALVERSLEIGNEAGIVDAVTFHAIMRLALLPDVGDEGSDAERRSLSESVPEHYPSHVVSAALGHLSRGCEPAELRKLLDDVAASSYPPWSRFGGPRDSALLLAATLAAGETALGTSSAWTTDAYRFLAKWPGQLFGNIVWNGPTESYLAGLAPLAGHADDLDALSDEAVRLSDSLESPLSSMNSRLLSACGFRLRGRPGDGGRSKSLLTAALEIGDRHGAASVRLAIENYPVLQS